MIAGLYLIVIRCPAEQSCHQWLFIQWDILISHQNLVVIQNDMRGFGPICNFCSTESGVTACYGLRIIIFDLVEGTDGSAHIANHFGDRGNFPELLVLIEIALIHLVVVGEHRGLAHAITNEDLQPVIPTGDSGLGAIANERGGGAVVAQPDLPCLLPHNVHQVVHDHRSGSEAKFAATGLG